MKLTPRLTLTFIIYAAALLTVVGALAYSSGRNSLRSATISELSAISIEKQAALNQWVAEKQKNIASISTDPTIIADASNLFTASNALEAQTAYDTFMAEVQPHVAIGEFLALMLIDPQTGEVLAATDPGEEGKFQENRPFFIKGKAGPFVQNIYFSTTLQIPAMTASAPLIGPDGQLLGVLAGRINLEEMNSIITRRSGLHETDDAFLVNTSNLFVTQPYLKSDPAVLQIGVHTEAVNRCLKKTSGTLESDDYRGVPSVIAYRWLPERELCLIVKIDQQEAYAPARAFGGTIAGFSALALLIAAGLAVVLSRSLSQPILALQSGAIRFREGDLDLRLPETSHDELGELAREFNQMAASLSEKDNQLRAYSFELEKRVDERTSELQQSEERFRLVTAASPNAMLMSGRDGRISFANEAAVSLFGYTHEELIGSQIETLLPEKFRSSHPAFRDFFFQDSHPRVMGKGRDLHTLRKDGAEVPVEIGLSPVTTRDGMFALATITDIRERKQSENILAVSEIRYRRLFESAKDGILVLDAETGMIVDVNPFLLELLGFPREEFLEKKIWELGLFKDIAANQEAFAELLRKEYIRFENMPIETSAGLRIEVEFVSYVYEMKDKKLIQCNIRNITDRVKAEIEIRRANVELEGRVVVRTQELEVANKELEAFAYSVSHDLRAPLRSIDGFSQALLEDYGDQLPDEGHNYLKRVRASAQRMAELIDDLLNLSRVSRAQFEPGPVDLSHLALNIVSELQRAEPGRAVELSIAPGIQANGDAHLLQVVLENLLNNAWKFTSKKEGARIEFGSKNEDGETIYFVRDNGAGFDMTYAGKLFGAFQRLHAMTEYPGTGIGLATVQRIIHRHGGRVWAEGALDQGAAFYFSL